MRLSSVSKHYFEVQFLKERRKLYELSIMYEISYRFKSIWTYVFGLHQFFMVWAKRQNST